MAIGLGLALVGALMWFGGKMGLGSLPGDIPLSGRGWKGTAPITTSIILSLLLTLVLNVLWRIFNR
jgi:hypothetical protein